MKYISNTVLPLCMCALTMHFSTHCLSNPFKKKSSVQAVENPQATTGTTSDTVRAGLSQAGSTAKRAASGFSLMGALQQLGGTIATVNDAVQGAQQIKRDAAQLKEDAKDLANATDVKTLQNEATKVSNEARQIAAKDKELEETLEKQAKQAEEQARQAEEQARQAEEQARQAEKQARQMRLEALQIQQAAEEELATENRRAAKLLKPSRGRDTNTMSRESETMIDNQRRHEIKSAVDELSEGEDNLSDEVEALAEEYNNSENDYTPPSGRTFQMRSPQTPSLPMSAPQGLRRTSSHYNVNR